MELNEIFTIFSREKSQNMVVMDGLTRQQVVCLFTKSIINAEHPNKFNYLVLLIPFPSLLSINYEGPCLIFNLLHIFLLFFSPCTDLV